MGNHLWCPNDSRGYGIDDDDDDDDDNDTEVGFCLGFFRLVFKTDCDHVMH